MVGFEGNLEITCTSEFFNDAKIWHHWKTHECMLFQNCTTENMLLLVNNIKGNIRNKNTRNTTVLTSRSLPFTFSLKTLNWFFCCYGFLHSYSAETPLKLSKQSRYHSFYTIIKQNKYKNTKDRLLAGFEFAKVIFNNQHIHNTSVFHEQTQQYWSNVI